MIDALGASLQHLQGWWQVHTMPIAPPPTRRMQLKLRAAVLGGAHSYASCITTAALQSARRRYADSHSACPSWLRSQHLAHRLTNAGLDDVLTYWEAHRHPVVPPQVREITIIGHFATAWPVAFRADGPDEADMALSFVNAVYAGYAMRTHDDDDGRDIPSGIQVQLSPRLGARQCQRALRQLEPVLAYLLQAVLEGYHSPPGSGVTPDMLGWVLDDHAKGRINITGESAEPSSFRAHPVHTYSREAYTKVHICPRRPPSVH